jgi:TolB protein
VTAGRLLCQPGFRRWGFRWRRAAPQMRRPRSPACRDRALSSTRVVYVAETGPRTNRMKRIAIMDSDGSNHRYLTAGQSGE